VTPRLAFPLLLQNRNNNQKSAPCLCAIIMTANEVEKDRDEREREREREGITSLDTVYQADKTDEADEYAYK